MFRTALLTTAAVIAMAAPALAEDATTGAEQQTAFSRAINAIKGWYGSSTTDAAQPVETEVSMEKKLDIWFGPKEGFDTDTAKVEDTAKPAGADGVQDIEPAAGTQEEMLQVPPPYVGPQSNAAPANNGPVTTAERATAFDGNPAMAAFDDATQPSAADIANIAPAAGEGAAPDMAAVDCKAVLKAAQSTEEGAEMPDTAMVEACDTPTDSTGEPVKAPAQPGFEDALPSTQPAAGEPPVGGAVMPGEKQPTE